MGQKTVNDPNAELRSVGSFHSIQVGGAFTVMITQGNEESLAVSASDKDDVADITTKVEDGILKIGLQSKRNWWPKSRQLRAYISIKTLKKLKVSGAASVRFEGDVKTDDLIIGLSGASNLKGRVFVNGKLDINLSGASDIDIKGTAVNTMIDSNGASDFDGYEFSTQNCEAYASGASSISLTVDKELSAKLSGASKMRYKGAAVVRNINTSGSSSISRKS